MHRLASHTPGPWLVSPLRALDVAGRCAGTVEHLAMVDAALRLNKIAPSDLEAMEVSDAGRAAYLREHSTPTAGSLPETFMRVGMRAAGLHVEPQVSFRGVGRVDFLVNRRLIVECDGRRYHSDERQFSLDRRRDRALSALGYRVLRFTYADAVHRTRASVHEVQSVLSVESISSRFGTRL